MLFKPNRLPKYSETDVIQEISRVVRGECGGEVPGPIAFEKIARVSLNSLRRMFGSYREAIAKAGFTYTARRKYAVSRRKFTTEQVKANLREVLDRTSGFQFTYNFYRNNGGHYAIDTIKSILGTNWEGALNAIGAKKQPRIVHLQQVTVHSQRRKMLSSLTEDAMLKEFDRVWRANGRCPTRPEFSRASQFKSGLYERRFGSWSRAIAACCRATGRRIPKMVGVPVGWNPESKRAPFARVSKEHLLDELRAVSERVSAVAFTYDNYKKSGGAYSIATFQEHFGGWTKAVMAVERQSVRTKFSYSKDDLFEEMQRLWEQLGRQPTFSEMEKSGRISPYTYHKKFGGWTSAVHAFCEDRNSDSALAAPIELSICDIPSIEPKIEDASPQPAISSNEPLPLFVVHKTSRNVPPKLRFRVFQRDNFTCQVCGRSRSKDSDLVIEADHKTAWTNGGESVLENLQTLCSKCNRGKSNL